MSIAGRQAPKKGDVITLSGPRLLGIEWKAYNRHVIEAFAKVYRPVTDRTAKERFGVLLYDHQGFWRAILGDTDNGKMVARVKHQGEARTKLEDAFRKAFIVEAAE